MAVEHSEELGKYFKGGRFAQNNIEVVVDFETLNYIPIAAADTDQTHQLNIPYPHRLVAMLIYHTDASDAASEAKLNVDLDRKVGQNYPAGFKEAVFNEDDIVTDTVCENFGENFERPASIYTLTLQCETISHRIYVVFYIQKLGKVD